MKTAGRPKKVNKMNQFQVSIEPEYMDQLRAIAEDQQRSLSFLARQAIIKMLGEQKSAQD